MLQKLDHEPITDEEPGQRPDDDSDDWRSDFRSYLDDPE
jgi:hypothetical protein